MHTIISSRRFTQLTSTILTVILMGVCSIDAPGRARYPDSFYQPLYGLPVGEIVEKGNRTQNPDSALAYYTVAIRSFENSPRESDHVDYIKALNNAGYYSLFHFKDYKESYTYLLLAEDEASRVNDEYMLAAITLNLANVLMGCNDVDGALRQYRESINYSLKTQSWDTYFPALTSFVFYSVMEKRWQNIGAVIKEFRTNQFPEEPLCHYTRLVCDGVELMLGKDYAGAGGKFDEANSHIDAVLTPERYPVIPILLKAEACRLAGDYRLAINGIADSFGSLTPENRIDAYKYLGELYAELQDSVNSNRYRLMYYDALNQSGHFGHQVDASEAKATFDRMLLNKDIDRLSAANKKAWQIIVYGGIAAFVLIALLLLLWRANRRLLHSKEALFLKNRQLLRKEVKTEEETAGDAYVEKTDADEKKNVAEEGSRKEELAELWRRIEKIMNETDEKFNPDFSLNRFAVMVNEHPRKVSGAVNGCSGKNFNAWLAEIRVNEACRRLQDKERYGRYTISSIAESLGFKSRTYFAEVFKKQTGLSPSEYQKIAYSKVGQMSE